MTAAEHELAVDGSIPLTYVVGSSHSGSTLLALLADAHPEIASVGETAIKPRLRREGRAGDQHCGCGTRLAECEFWQGIFDDVSRAGVRFDIDHWVTDYRFTSAWMDAALTRETSSWARRRVAHWLARHAPALRARTARVDAANIAFVRAVLARRNRRVFLDTTKLLTRVSYLLDLPAFDVRVLHLVRDVRGVAASAKRRGASLVEASHIWLNDQRAIERLRTEHPRLPFMRVRYEDLCASPTTVLRDVWRFCGVAPLDVPPVVHPRRHHVLGNSMRLSDSIEVTLDERWRTALDTAETQRVLDIAGPQLLALGYAR